MGAGRGEGRLDSLFGLPRKILEKSLLAPPGKNPSEAHA